VDLVQVDVVEAEPGQRRVDLCMIDTRDSPRPLRESRTGAQTLVNTCTLARGPSSFSSCPVTSSLAPAE
jgi:hypothetical protein